MTQLARVVALVSVVLSGGCLRADPLKVLGTAAGFAVLGSSTVTNTGATMLTGNLGLSDGPSITGFPPGSVTSGAIYVQDAATAQAHSDALAGYATLAAMTPTRDLSGTDLGGLTLTPGVFSFATSADLTGTLTLDFGGASNALFVFQTGSTFMSGTGAIVNVVNLGANDDVYFAVGSSATIGAASQLQGYIVASQSITMGTGASIASGDAIALNAAVTLNANRVSIDAPAASAAPSVASAPEPAGFLLVGTGMVAIWNWRRTHSLR